MSPSESWPQLLEHPPKSPLPPSLLLTGFAYLAVVLQWIVELENCASTVPLAARLTKDPWQTRADFLTSVPWTGKD